MSSPASLESLVAEARRDFDLTRVEDQQSVRALAEAFETHRQEDVRAAVRSAGAAAPLGSGIAALLAGSRRWLREHSPQTVIGIVFAMWGEHNRLLPAGPDNPNGENSLVTKLEQLEWATRDAPDLRWTLYAPTAARESRRRLPPPTRLGTACG